MNNLTLEYTTNLAPTDIDATLAHYNIIAEIRILRTFPTKRIQVITDAEPEQVKEICNANALT